MASNQNLITIPIHLHPKQGVALLTPATEVLYGGAAGGGKSFLMRAAAILWATEIPGLQVYVFRRLFPDLIKNHMEGPKGFRALLADWERAGFAKIVEEEIRFWNGSKIYLCHCKDDGDRFKYQGAEIHVLLVDELTHFSEVVYRFLRSRVRMSGINLPEKYVGKFPRILCASNPGNVGHLFVKSTFIDGVRPLELRHVAESEGGMIRQFIPARLDDNPSMTEDDPTYRAKLRGLGNEALVRAMEEGDWDVVAGAFFEEFSRDRHVVRPFEVPEWWMRFGSFDWGSARPFSYGLYAVSDGTRLRDGRWFPAGAMIRYQEWYGASAPNVGLKLTAEQVAEGILSREGNQRIAFRVADPACWKWDGGPSIAERMGVCGVDFIEADNSRVAGWDQVRGRLLGDDEPMLYFFDTCTEMIRTLPAMQHDERKAEDIDCWVADTLVSTPNGDRRIADICVGEFVDTPIGPRPVLRSYLSGTSATVRVTLSDGRVLEGTPHHKIMIEGIGLVALGALECHMVPKERIMWPSVLNIVASSIRGMRGVCITIRTGLSSLLAERVCIGRYGLMQVGASLMGGTSITSMGITTTTNWQTSNACLREHMVGFTWESGSLVSLDNGSRLGVSRMPDEILYAQMLARCGNARLRRNVRAEIVVSLLLRDIMARNFVLRRAQTLFRTLSARFAGGRSGASRIRRNGYEPVHIVAVGRYEGKTPVYNLTVADAHLFYANGVLSSNTNGEDHLADELRYACMARSYVRRNENEAYGGGGGRRGKRRARSVSFMAA